MEEKSIHGAERMGLNSQTDRLKEKIKHLAGKTGREKQRRRDVFWMSVQQFEAISQISAPHLK